MRIVSTVSISSATPYIPGLNKDCSGWLGWVNFGRRFLLKGGSLLHAGLQTGTDTSDIALARAASEKAFSANVECDFVLADFLKSKIEGAPFRFAFDRGCFHAFNSENGRKVFAQNEAAHLEETGLWLTLVGTPMRFAMVLVRLNEPLQI